MSGQGKGAPSMRALIDALTGLLGADAVLNGDSIGPRYHSDWTRAYSATPIAVVLPRSTSEVSSIMKLCHEAGQTVVPQGGLTGLAGGAIPCATDLCLSLERMRGIQEIDESAASMTVLAGTTLQSVQEAAARAGFEFSVDMGSRGSCQIGGMIATNAGGMRVVQSGTMRDQVLGLEAVLADGTILDSTYKLLKNNTGYDLKHWFIGSEGTLGVITRAVLRLRARPVRRSTALCALSDYAAALELLRDVRGAFGNALSAFEIMWADFFEFAVSVSASRKSPFAESWPLYALVEAHAGELDEALSAVDEAVISSSAAEARALWALRDAPGEFATHMNPMNYDVSLPIGDIGSFVDECRQVFESHWPGHRSFFFGHIGDSNLHVTVALEMMQSASHKAVDAVFYPLVGNFRGSISAEHGIGVLKRDFLSCSRSEAELAAMWTIKNALDPSGILNPGKVLPPRGGKAGFKAY